MVAQELFERNKLIMAARIMGAKDPVSLAAELTMCVAAVQASIIKLRGGDVDELLDITLGLQRQLILQMVGELVDVPPINPFATFGDEAEA